MSSTATPASTPDPDAAPQAAASPASSPGTKPRKKRSWRRILIIAATLALALAVIGRVVLAVGFPHVLAKVAAAYDLEATYSRMELYLLSGDVGLWNLTVRPKAGGPALMTTEYARGDVSTLNLLRGKLAVTRAELDGMMLDVRREADGRIPALEKLLAGGGREDAEAMQLSLDPPLRADAVRVNRLRAHWVDLSVQPAVDTELEVTLRLSDVGVPGRPMRLLLEGSSPPLLDTLRVEGTADTRDSKLDANFNVLVRGLHPRPAAGYLAPLGIRAVGENITLTAATEVKLAMADPARAGASTRPAEIAGVVTITKVSARGDDHEAAGADCIVIEADAVGGTAIRLAKVTIDGVRASASRTAEGNIRFAGLELAEPAPSTRPAPASVTDAATPSSDPPPATQPSAAPPALALGELKIRNLRAAFRDDAVSPVADLALLIEQFALTGIDSARPDSPAKLTAVLSSPGMARTIRLDGTALPFAKTRTLDAKLVTQGIRPDAIRGYLDALGLESTFTEGTLTGDLRAAVAVSGDGVLHADARLANVKLLDGALGDGTGELLALESAHVSGLSIDPAGSRVRVEAVDLVGPRLAARRNSDGSLAAVGLRTRLRGPTTSPAPVSAAVRPAAPTAAAIARARPTTPPTSPASAPPRFELGRFTWKGVDVQFVDQAITPATNVRLNNTGVEVADLVVDLAARGAAAATPAATGTVRAWLTAPGIAEALNVDGTVAPAAGALTADLSVTGKGLRGGLLAPYLKALGIEPALRDGSLQLRTRVALARKENDAIAASLAVEQLRYAEGQQELIGLDRLAVDDAELTRDGVAVTSIQIDKPRARAQRNADGSLSIAGLRVNIPSTQPAEEEVPAAAASGAAGDALPSSPSASSRPAAAPFVAKLGKLRVNDASLAWADQAVSPTVDATGRASVELDAFVFGSDPAPPASIKFGAKLDQTLEQFSATGTFSPSATSPMVKLDLAGTGIRQGVLAPYLPPGMNVALKDGRFRAALEAAVAPHAKGGQSARLVISKVDYRDGEEGQPLLAFDSARVLVSRADVPGKVIDIDEVSLSDLQTGARKAADGSLHVLGVKLGAAPPPVSNATTAPAAPTAQAPAGPAAAPSTQPSGSTDVNALIAAGREKLPLITLKTLAVGLRRVSFADESRPQASPLALADVMVRNTAPIELLGADPQSRPPVNVELVGKVDPLVGSFTVAMQVAPFASQPSLEVALNAEGINGAGLTAIVPELREQIDGAPLADGRFAAALEASAKVARRGPAQLDFSRPMEIAAVVRDVAFRADGSENSPVLAGVQEVRADGVRVDPSTGSVIARSVEISKPIASAWRDADGIHALGMLIKLPSTQPASAAPATRPTEASPTPPSPDSAVLATASAANGGLAGAKPQAEVRIEKLTVSGIDLKVEDRAVEPPLVVPLNSLEAEIRGLSNLALHEPLPIRFNVTAGTAKVPLGQDKPPREMFAEAAASGNLTLYPAPRGWARSTVSGLEMLALRGPAAAAKVNIEGGVFDSRVDVRFQEDGSLNTRSRFAFTDLRVNEPADGVIRRVLKLPGPLDAMIIVLQDASGAITVPLNVTVEQNNVSGGQIAGAAVTALGSILATAMASAPLKVTGGVTELVGIDQAIPMPGGGGKKQTGPQDAGAIDFFAGAGEASSDEATITLQQVIDRMRRDRTLEVTLRHELGGGDIARAAQRANPSPEAAAALGQYLRQRKASLLQRRDELASAARATIASHAADGTANEAVEQLRDVEAQLAAAEDALDRAYDLTRPGADRQAERRTRAASLEIAEARLEAMKQLILAAGVPDAENRVRVIKPQFNLVEGESGGKVTMVVTSKKKP